MINQDFLIEEAKKLGVPLGDYGAERFDIYAERLVSWNRRINLTTITQPDDIVIKHFLDSLSVLHYVKMEKGQRLIDVGTGAGFPGIPLLMAEPELDVTFLDSLCKRISFLRDVLKTTGLFAETVHGRAEELGKEHDFRECYDYAVARAVAPLNILCEYCLPFVRPGGLFIAMKGADSEASSAEHAIQVLGGTLEEVSSFKLPNGDPRNLVFIKKVSQTPTKYPRKSKKINTRPL